MKRRLLTVMLTLTILLGAVLHSSAQNTIDITSFTTTFTEVGHSALLNRSARIPVSWTTNNRPLTANLVFEQILPDGSTINVELPRIIPFVASNGNGIAAPILPNGNITNIVLRVSLVNLFNDFVYDYEEIVIPIVQGNSGSDGNGFVPAVVEFTPSYSAPINRTELNNGNVRVPVQWRAINRPTWLNLVFEQVLPDGTVANVELPRPFLWVNSQDSGMVAPVSVGETADQIVLRVRLVDISNNTFDQLYAYIPVQTEQNAVAITSFSTTTDNIVRGDIGSIIDVSWSVSNRPTGTNLVFEQILPDGTVRNAELPRDVLIVPSVGTGAVVPTLPPASTPELVFRLRVVDLSNNSTLDSAQINIPIFEQDAYDRVIVTGDTCFTSPFFNNNNNNIAIGDDVRVQQHTNNSSALLFEQADNYIRVGDIETGEIGTVIDGPYCTMIPAINGSDERRWLIEADGVQGWVTEYDRNYSTDIIIIILLPADQDPIPVASIESFTVTPDNVDGVDLDNTTFTLTWETSNATHVSLDGMEISITELDGSTTISGADIPATDVATFTLRAYDSQNNFATADANVTINSTLSIDNFSVNVDTAKGNEPVTFTWEITGDFRDAYIEMPIQYSPETILTINSNTGSEVYTLPEWTTPGDKTITLIAEDEFGAQVTYDISMTNTCTYEWQLTVDTTLCPSQLLSRTGAYQEFQRGFMIWIPDTIFVFYDDGSVSSYNDDWDGNDYAIDGTPPEGTFAPERGFGYLWSTTPQVRSGLGWATAPEQSYTVESQGNYIWIPNNPRIAYYKLPDGSILKYQSTGGTIPNYSWSILD